jgi:lipopolysaccharide/colanic/teichoic acid biosynthesis glycosyltransferase
MLVIAIVIKATSHGPVIFKQVRVGEFGREFTLYKFRSMVANAADGSAEAGTGAVWKTANDPRFTRIGRILERTHLDELPQLINILKGDASFVGPRPERPRFVAELKEKIPYYELRHLVRPGIAGWAQLQYKYGASVEDAYQKLQYDLYYLKNRSLLLDASIILKTFKLFFTRPA